VCHNTDNDVNTFHCIQRAIQRHVPSFFLVGNVSGVALPRSAIDRSTPLVDMVLDDDTHGLRHVKGTKGKQIY
jgi:hypothetical protein